MVWGLPAYCAALGTAPRCTGGKATMNHIEASPPAHRCTAPSTCSLRRGSPRPSQYVNWEESMSTSNQVAIEAVGLVKKYGTTTALAGVDLSVPTGTVLGVLGPNGAGKTTAVRILGTLVRPDGGHAKVGGYDVVREAGRVRETIGLTGQYASVDEDMSGRRNLIMIGRLLGLPRAQAKVRAGELLERFELSDAGDRIAKTYSGGMRRRLDLASSLVGNPSILYLEEPTTGLDPHARNGVWETVRNLVLDGTTVLLTTQYLEEADALADSIVVFDKRTV